MSIPPVNRLAATLAHIQPTAPAADAVDPHAVVPIPSWARVNVVAEPGTRFRYLDHCNGLLSIYVRERHALDWPHGTPNGDGNEQEYAIGFDSNTFFVANNLFRAVDHQFQPSVLDTSVCTVCARPSRQRWLLEYVRQQSDGQMEPQAAWFDDHDEALEERGRLANQKDVVALSLRQAVYREEPDVGD